jgi:hypothetical protein
VRKVFDENGKLIDQRYEKKVVRFLEEFEWYIEAFKNQRERKVLRIRWKIIPKHS